MSTAARKVEAEQSHVHESHEKTAGPKGPAVNR